MEKKKKNVTFKEPLLAPARYTASPEYLVEAELDREWERKYQIGNRLQSSPAPEGRVRGELSEG